MYVSKEASHREGHSTDTKGLLRQLDRVISKDIQCSGAEDHSQEAGVVGPFERPPLQCDCMDDSGPFTKNEYLEKETFVSRYLIIPTAQVPWSLGS